MEIEVVSPIEAEAEVKRYTLVSDDIFVRSDSASIPSWYKQLIEDIISTDPTITDVQSAIEYLGSVDSGYNIKFANLDTWQSSVNATLETLSSNYDGNTASIANIETTYATKDFASATSIDAVQSYLEGGSANAWFTSMVSTYASDIETNALSISTLSSTLDGHTVSIDTIDSIAQTAYDWSANASKLITNPSGQITGWSFGDGTNSKSFFDIYADNFRIVNSTYNFVPFSISGSNIVFNGKVSINGIETPFGTSLGIYRGEFSSDPIGVFNNGDTYKNTTTGVIMIYANSVWTTTKGEQGIQGIAGEAGADGVVYYTWVKYADTPTSGISDYPDGKAYLGIAHNKTTATESTTYSDYTWSLIKGEQGIAGINGVDGQTYYTWIKYADDSLGTNMSDSPTGKIYIGIAVNKTISTESTIATDYTWSLIKGADGVDGTNGVDGSRGAGWFSAVGTSWSDTVANNTITSLGLTKVLADKVTISSGTFSATKYWNGTSWIDAALYVSGNMVVSGSITSSQIAANTITASEINTASIQAAVVTADAVNALTITADSVAAENITGTTISGKTISGGTITGTTINASTINIRDLNLINDAGYTIVPFFGGITSIGSGIPNAFNFTSGFYTYNSSASTSAKLSAASGVAISFAEIDTTDFYGDQYLDFLPICSSGYAMTITVYIKCGTSTIVSKSIGSPSTTIDEVGGIGFVYLYDSSFSNEYWFGIRPINTNVSLSSTSSSPVSIYITVGWSGSIRYRNKGLSYMVSNL